MVEENKLRIAVVGAGPAGQAHAFGFRNATMTDRLAGITVELDTIVDPVTERAERVARRYGFRRVAADVQAVIDDPTIDVVSIALPNHLSVPVLSALLRAGKHVLGEKPLGRNAGEAQELATIAESTGRVAAVGFSYRRIPALAQLREAVLAGAIGTPYFARAHFLADYALDPNSPMAWRYDLSQSGGGVSLDMATHAVDALEYILGPVAEVLSCSMDTVVRRRPSAEGGMADVTNDDTFLLNFRFGDGALATLLASRVAAGETIDLGFEIHGSEGHVKYTFTRSNEWTLYQRGVGAEGLDAPRVIQPGPGAPYFEDTMPMAARGNATGYGEAFIAEMQDFLVAVATGEAMDTSFAAAAATMRVLDAAFESAVTHAPVRVIHEEKELEVQ